MGQSEDCKGDGFQCSLSLLATSPIVLTCRINTLVRSVLLWSNNRTTTTMLRLLLSYQFWVAETCICHRPSPARKKTHDLQIASQGRLWFCFLYSRHSTRKTRSHVLNFEVSHFVHHFLLLPSFLPFSVAMKGIHSTQLCCHISFLSLVWLTTCFFFIWPGTVARFT